jgi:hypothetical protein
VPHFYTSIECEIDEILSLRKMFKKDMDLNISGILAFERVFFIYFT